ncbi:MAG: SDR family oxidoreductase [Acidimicrobiales bacterium]|jgi:NAD(P)-dependent dehydrogenase (short-subunit alcohol dehydrogenase family)|nr:SDR family oxidoreductase [Acidimicrobiales bacterium]
MGDNSMGVEAFRFDGKRALVVGGATGMGAATAVVARDLGAEVVVMDHVEVDVEGVKSIRVDLRDKDGIDAAVDECGGPIHALFSCAGVADGTPGIEKINFIGHRHLIDRVVGNGWMPKGSAIGMISSAAGLGWEKDLDQLKEYLDTPDFDAAVAWHEANPGHADYMWSKKAICAYVARESFPMLQKGIRLNAILPGPTDTPLAQANAELWLSFGQDFRAAAGIEASTPEEQADVLVFLCSHAARYINGLTVVTDAGYVSAGITGSFPDATPVVGFLRGDY